MADDKAKDQEKAPANPKKKQTMLMVSILAVVMVVEGVGVFCAVKFLGGGPAIATAEGLAGADGHGAEGGGQGGSHGEESGASNQPAELPVTKLKAPNLKSGRLYIYEMEIYARVKPDKSAALKKTLEGTRATIDDRLNRIIRSADPSRAQPDRRRRKNDRRNIDS